MIKVEQYQPKRSLLINAGLDLWNIQGITSKVLDNDGNTLNLIAILISLPEHHDSTTYTDLSTNK